MNSRPSFEGEPIRVIKDDVVLSGEVLSQEDPLWHAPDYTGQDPNYKQTLLAQHDSYLLGLNASKETVHAKRARLSSKVGETWMCVVVLGATVVGVEQIETDHPTSAIVLLSLAAAGMTNIIHNRQKSNKPN